MKKSPLIYLACAGLAVSLIGCVRSEMFVMVGDAEAKIAEAESAGAAKAAPYELESSKRWLDMAKHEADELDSAGYQFAKNALDKAEAALAKAKGGSK